jgi:hypothetical protein
LQAASYHADKTASHYTTTQYTNYPKPKRFGFLSNQKLPQEIGIKNIGEQTTWLIIGHLKKEP